MPSLYNKKNAAQALGISVETLDRYKKNGKLPFHQIGDRILFTENDLNTFIDACAVSSTVKPSVREKAEMAKVAVANAPTRNSYEYESVLHIPLKKGEGR